jgi:hypothetical protein
MKPIPVGHISLDNGAGQGISVRCFSLLEESDSAEGVLHEIGELVTDEFPHCYIRYKVRPIVVESIWKSLE